MKKKIISCDNAINEIGEILLESGGDWIIKFYQEITGKKAKYLGDSLIEVIESDEDNE